MTATEVLDAYPLAAMQAGMLFASSYEESSAKYHDLFTLTVRGEFDREALVAAIGEIVAVQPVLRTSFDIVNLDEPAQLVHAEATVPVDVHDWRGRDGADARAALAAWRTAEERRPFVWIRPPLLRITVHLLPAGEFAMSLHFHHAILDGWSLHTLTTELLNRYLARLDGRPLPVRPPSATFGEFVADEQAATANEPSASYWRDLVADAPLCSVPALGEAPTDPPDGAGQLEANVDAPVRDRLAGLARELRVPLRTVLLAAHLRVIGLLSGQSEVLTGYVAHNRPETEDGAEVLGLFVNSLPLRMALDAPSWAELIQRVYRAEVAAIPHRAFPMFEIQRLAGRSPLFETMFDYRNFHVYEGLPRDGRLVPTGYAHREHTDIPFTAVFSTSSDGELYLSLKYDPHRYREDEIRAALGRYARALELIAENPGGDPRGAAAFVGEHERALLDGWNDTAWANHGPAVLHEIFFDQADRTPDAIAVVDEAGEHTYERIRRRANGLAARLRTLGAGPETVVAIHLDRGAGFVIALLGVLRAGAAALPLDRDHPDQRKLQATADANAALLLTGPDEAVSFPFNGLRLSLDATEAETGPPVTVSPDGLAYLLYTSGSTGRPKGVMLSHRAATEFTRWAAGHTGIEADDRVAQRTPVAWDAALVELFMAFDRGASAVVVSTEAMADPATLIETVNTHRITFLLLVPSLLAVHLDAGTFAETPTLRIVASAGEALTQQAVDTFAEQSSARLYNFYGPTESGIGVSQSLAIPGARRPVVPIGTPTGNVRLYVLDALDQPVPVGVAGELHVGADQLARGYLGRPALTAERFVPDHLSGRAGARLYRTGDLARWLPDGQLDFLGRRDGQVKIRGARVELGEIDAALLEHPKVRQAVTLARVGRDGRLALVAYVVAADAGPDADEAGLVDDLRRQLRTRLIRAAVPTSITVLEQLPVLSNGKLDRAALPAPEIGTRAPWVAPRDPVEARLSSLWAETLGVEAVGVRDDFFDLGGHSLVALRLTMRLRHELGREIPVETVISASTVERLAAVLRGTGDVLPATPVVPLRESPGEGPPLFIMHGLGGQIFRYHLLVRRLRDDRPAYAIPATGFAAGETPHTSLESMADDYADRIQAVHPHGPYLLCGHCIGGNIAIEVARRLRERGEPVPLVTMFWTHANEPVIKRYVSDDVSLMMQALAGGANPVDPQRLVGLSPDEQLLAIIAAASASGELIAGAEDIAQARRIFEVYRANAHAVVDYRHARYDGDVLLLVPEEDEFVPGDVFGWDEVVAGRLHVADIPGHRGTCLDEPLVQRTGAILQDWIDRVVAAR
jgi:amino acid adenylation domain-containing protein